MSPSDPPAEDSNEPASPGPAVPELPSLPRYRRRPREFYLLWTVALLTYGVGDVATTTVAVFTRPNLIESNPFLAWAPGPFGFYWFLGIKLAVFLVMVAISVRDDEWFAYYWPPVATAVIGAGLTTWNLYLLSTAG